MRKVVRKGISAGTVAILIAIVLILGGSAALFSVFTGNTDIRLDAKRIFVAFDRSFSELSETAVKEFQNSKNLVSSPKAVPFDQDNPFFQSTEKPAVVSTPVPSVEPKKSFTLCAGGSIHASAKSAKELTVDQEVDYQILTDQMVHSMDADLSIATLENLVIPSGKVTDSNQPLSLLNAIRTMGVNALCNGYPGILDSGITGLLQTQDAISGTGITPFGVYTSQEQHDQIHLLETNGVKVALLHFQNELNKAAAKKLSKEERAFVIDSMDEAVMTSAVSEAKKREADVVIVTLCWGKVGAGTPTDSQKQTAQLLANAGADIILGTHSGVVQPAVILTADRKDGKYHPVLCAYSLGNLFTTDRNKRNALAGTLLHATIVLDPQSKCIAFDHMTYRTTYS